MSERVKRAVGRPPGSRYTRKGHFYGAEEDFRRLDGLKARWGLSESATVRRALAEAAKREKVD